MFPVYGGKCLSRKAVRSWVEKFSQGLFESCWWCPTRSPSWDCDRSDCVAGGRVGSSWQEDNDRQCSNCTGVLPWFSIQHNAWSFEVSESVPRELKDRGEMNPVGLSLQHLLRYADDGEDMLNRTVSGDESWKRHYQPETERASVQWKHPSSPWTKTWPRQQSKDFYAAGFDALAKSDGTSVWMFVEDMSRNNFFFFRVRISHILGFIYPFVTYLLTLPRT
jgi:hypothetical protein